MKIKNKGEFCYKTDIGKVRPVNEDNAFSVVNPSGDVLLGVFDGFGGATKGDTASYLAASTLVRDFKAKNGFLSLEFAKAFLIKSAKKINKIIYETSLKDASKAGMGTTMCVALLRKNKILILNAGDSRAYKLVDDKFEQLTKDQTFVEVLSNTGKIKEEEKSVSIHRHVLMNSIGTTKNVNFILDEFENNFSSLLLCSDGLYNNTTDAEIKGALVTNERLGQKVDSLIEIANSNGGSDNIAISLWERVKC